MRSIAERIQAVQAIAPKLVLPDEAVQYTDNYKEVGKEWTVVSNVAVYSGQMSR